jgi:hypothetical protein
MVLLMFALSNWIYSPDQHIFHLVAQLIRPGISIFLYLFDDVDNFIVVVFQCHVRPFRMAVSVLPFSCRLCVYFRRAVDMLALRNF